MPEQTNEADFEQQLIDDIASFARDPLGYVLYAFPWGEPGPLSKFAGPDQWQRDILTDIGRRLREGSLSEDPLAWIIRIAVSSGHGIGKSALVAMIMLWSLSTMPDTRGVVTANTGVQLKTKTWAELAKWHGMAINRHWFEVKATAVESAEENHAKTWRIDAIAWKKEQSEAFAGTHNQGRRIVLIFDEASAIDPIIWTVTEGALTDEATEIIWLAFGNPTRSDGRFYDCFHKDRKDWTTRKIDGRTVSITNKAYLNSLAERYGEDSDIVKVRVRGEFPSASVSQFIGTDLIDAAKERARQGIQEEVLTGAPVILALDVARFGDDASSLWLRKGIYTRRIFSVMQVDTMTLATMVANATDKERPRAVFIDITGGLGAGVYDRLVQMGYGAAAVPVNFGASAVKSDRYANKRTEMYADAKEWLIDGGTLPPDGEEAEKLSEDLAAIDYYIDRKSRVALEDKEDIKEKLGRSPDDGDAFVLTFAAPVVSTEVEAVLASSRTARGDYNPLDLRAKREARRQNQTGRRR